MNKAKQGFRWIAQAGYARFFSLRGLATVSIAALCGSSLLACEPTASSAPLMVGEMVGVRGYPENASRASANVFKFQCQNVQQVSMQVLRVQAGVAETISDVQYQRPQGADSTECLAAVSYRQAEAEEVAQAEFMFADHLTSAAGEMVQAVSTSSRPGFGASGSGSSSSYLSSGAVIASSSPEILYWQLESPSQSGLTIASFTSINDMKAFTQRTENAKVWAVTVQPTE